MTHLVAALWQGLAVALVTAALLALARKISAATRYWIWWTALAAVATLTAVHALRAVTAFGPADAAAAAAADGGATGILLPGPPEWTLPALAALWMASAMISFWTLARGLRVVARIRRRARPLPAIVEQQLPFWSALPPAERGARLMRSGDIASACAVGRSRQPLIVISDVLLARLEATEIDQIVMHERAHLLRRDDWAQVVQACVTGLFGLHPAVRFISSRLNAEREMACDDTVVAVTGAAAAYAGCLALAAEAAAESTWPAAFAPGAVEPPTLLARVRRLLDPRADRSAHPRPLVLCAGVLLLCGAVRLGVSTAPLVIVGAQVSTISPEVNRPTLMAGARAAAIPASEVVERRPAGIRRSGNARPAAAPAAHDRPHRSTDSPVDMTAMAELTDGQPLETSQPRAAALPSVRLGSGTGVLAPSAAVRGADVNGWTAAGVAVADSATRIGLSAGDTSTKTGRAIGGFFARSARGIAARF